MCVLVRVSRRQSRVEVVRHRIDSTVVVEISFELDFIRIGRDNRAVGAGNPVPHFSEVVLQVSRDFGEIGLSHDFNRLCSPFLRERAVKHHQHAEEHSSYSHRDDDIVECAHRTCSIHEGVGDEKRIRHIRAFHDDGHFLAICLCPSRRIGIGYACIDHFRCDGVSFGARRVDLPGVSIIIIHIVKFDI